MEKNRKADKEVKNTLNVIEKNSQIIAKNTKCTNKKLEAMESDITAIKKSSTSKFNIIMPIIALLVSLSGVTFAGSFNMSKSKTESEVKFINDKSESESKLESEYKIYLYPEYSTFNIGAKINMIASLNFETDAVIITAHLASGRDDIVSLERKSATEWQKKVEFTETGVHKIVVSATTPSGQVIENSIEVKVTPVSIDIDSIIHYFGL